ncbi:MAG TPA: hypothetical protein ENK09_09340 [Nitrospirae bacterium]|nr:hypothetical protein [Nitrospirota bacterium]
MYALADLVVLGIRAGLKLSQQARQAYLESTISRELILPLPDFNPAINLTAATDYFMGAGKVHLEKDPGLKNLLTKAGSGDVTPEEKEHLINSYLEFKLVEDIDAGRVRPEKAGLTKEAINTIVTIRQWARGQSPYPSSVQRIVGSLIEIGIDYFSGKTSLIDEDTATGKALKGFLSSLEDLDFKTERIDRLLKGLFIASLESIEDNSALLSGDDKVRVLIESISRGIINDLGERAKNLSETDLSMEETLLSWGQIVLKSTISAASDVVLSNPATYLGVKDPSRQAMITALGRAVLDVVIDEDRLDIKPLFSRKNLDRLLKTALVTLSEHPELMGLDHRGVQRILSQIAGDLGRETEVLSPDLLPEMMRLILEKTALNIELLWPEDLRDDPSQHLLIVASKEVLSRLAALKEGDGRWSPSLAKSDLLEITEVVLDEIVENPDWLVKKATEEDTTLGRFIDTLLESLSRIPENRLSPALFREVFKSAISAVALRHALIEKISLGGREREAIGHVLDTIIDTIFSASSDASRWVLARRETLGAIVSAVLKTLAERGVDADSIEKIRSILNDGINRINSGGAWSLEAIISEIERNL